METKEYPKSRQPGRSFVGSLWRIVLPLLILGVGAGGLYGLYLLGTWSKLETQEAAAAEVPLVRTVDVAPHEGGLQIEVDGLVVPHREISLAAEVGGQVRTKAENCEAGSYVEQGQLLIEIDSRDFELEVRRITQELEQADVQLEELEVELSNTQGLVELAQEQLELRKKELARLQKLAEKDYATDSQLDQERQNELSARNQLMTLRNQMQLLRTKRRRLERAKDFTAARLAKAELDLERAKIYAPVDGVIIEDLVEQGDYVAPGTAVVRIEDTSAVEVKCNLRVDELYWLWDQQADEASPSAKSPQWHYQIPQAPVTVVYRVAGREYHWDGVLWRYDGLGLDPKTRTAPCRVLVRSPREVRYAGAVNDQFNVPASRPPGAAKLAAGDDPEAEPADALRIVGQSERAAAQANPAGRTSGRAAGTDSKPPAALAGPPALVRQMFVRVRIHARPKTRLLRLPEIAVQPGNRLWLFRDGKLRIVKVHVVDVNDDTVIVRSDADGVRSGDQVIVTTINNPYDGMPVEKADETGPNPGDRKKPPAEADAVARR